MNELSQLSQLFTVLTVWALSRGGVTLKTVNSCNS